MTQDDPIARFASEYEVEFWKSRDDRLHDRWLYERDGDAWHVARLYP